MNKEKEIYELLPSEPVDVAAMLIKATIVTDAPVFAPLSPMLEGKLVAIPKYDPVQLQEIAEHLLVYCNAQEEWMGGWHQNIGFVADELEEIDPNLALGGGYDENGEMDIKQINSPYLLNYAIKAIQELSAKVDEQEKRIKELERRLQ